MARTKSKSSKLASIIDQFNSGIKNLIELSDEINQAMADSQELKQLRPLITSLNSKLNPKSGQELSGQDDKFNDPNVQQRYEESINKEDKSGQDLADQLDHTEQSGQDLSGQQDQTEQPGQALSGQSHTRKNKHH